MQEKIEKLEDINGKLEKVCHMRVAAIHCDDVLTDIRGPQEVEETRKDCRQIHVAFGKTVDAQCDQPMNVARAFDLVKTESQKIVADAAAKMEGLIEGQKNGICLVLQQHLEFSKHQGEYLYTCKRISATLYTDVSLTQSKFKKKCGRESAQNLRMRALKAEESLLLVKSAEGRQAVGLMASNGRRRKLAHAQLSLRMVAVVELRETVGLLRTWKRIRGTGLMRSRKKVICGYIQ